MIESEEHINQIDLIHSIYNCKIRTIKDMINPSKEIIEMKANEKKLKEETIEAKKYYNIDNIEELKEQIHDITTYESTAKKTSKTVNYFGLIMTAFCASVTTIFTAYIVHHWHSKNTNRISNMNCLTTQSTVKLDLE
jgi:hypothetical protein